MGNHLIDLALRQRDDSKCYDSCHHTNQQEGDLLTIEVEITQTRIEIKLHFILEAPQWYALQYIIFAYSEVVLHGDYQ